MAGPVLLVCGSRKPAPGLEGRSAARELLRAVARGIEDEGGTCDWLDVRDLDLPFFDGRSVEAYGSRDLELAASAVEEHERIVLSVPAYWGGPAGVVKNLLDVLGGAAYDAPPDQEPPLAGKLVFLLVVGSDDSSAHLAHGALRSVLAAMGAWVAPRAAVVGNPRRARSVEALVAATKEFGAYVATAAVPEEAPVG
jgi:NAD(P)H-dependent FMN reductase